jgi:hypothetical protein
MRKPNFLATLLLGAIFATSAAAELSFYGVSLGDDAFEAEMALAERDLEFFDMKLLRDTPSHVDVHFDIGGKDVVVDEADLIDGVAYTHLIEGQPDKSRGTYVVLVYPKSTEVSDKHYAMLIQRTFEPGEVTTDQMNDWIAKKVGGAEPSCTWGKFTRYFFDKNGEPVSAPDLCSGYMLPITPNPYPYQADAIRNYDIEVGVTFRVGNADDPDHVSHLDVTMSHIPGYFAIMDTKKSELEAASSSGKGGGNPLSDM